MVDYPNTNNILIEVKFREGAPISDDDAISELCSNASAAIVVTKTSNDFWVHNTKTGKNLIRIPAFAFFRVLIFAGACGKNGYCGIE